MGGKNSKSQLQRNKSISKIGRSSQRGLFQKSKLKLNQIQRRLDDDNRDQIQGELNAVEEELGSISEVVKDKHREKYEEILQQVRETRRKFDEKFKVPIKEVQVCEALPEVVQVHVPDPEVVEVPQTELVAPPESPKITSGVPMLPAEVVEMRQTESVTSATPPGSPKIKFGVQVMPVAPPRISQEMLKNTLPTSPIAKEEFAEIRASYVNSTRSKTIFRSASIVEENGVVRNVQEISVEQTTSSNTIDNVRHLVDELENSMRYFHGTKGDFEYDQIHDRLVQNLVKLDNFDTDDNPVLKQEKKILIQRIQELLGILDRLGRPLPNQSMANEDNMILSTAT
uniref:BAG domain-containing protein n=1 Tax=Photinus pyralis TaxID=7054 RepID=A0A1Y1L3W4_PHOPY